MKKRYAVEDEERRTIPMSFKMKPSHHARLIEMAKAEDRSKTSLIERMVVEYFRKNKV